MKWVDEALCMGCAWTATRRSEAMKRRTIGFLARRHVEATGHEVRVRRTTLQVYR